MYQSARFFQSWFLSGFILALAVLAMPFNVSSAQAVPCGGPASPPCAPAPNSGGGASGQISVRIPVNDVVDLLRNRRSRIDYQDVALPESVAGQILFTYLGEEATARDIAQSSGMILIETYLITTLGISMGVAQIPAGTDPDTANQLYNNLMSDPRILSWQPNYIYQPLAPRRKPLPVQFRLAGYEKNAQLEPVTGRIALIDTPVDIYHPVFAGQTIYQEIIRDKAAAAQHGTAIASMLIGQGNIIGGAQGAEIFSYGAFAQTEGGKVPIAETRDLVKAIDKALQQRPAVVNLSFGGPKSDPLLSQLFNYAETLDTCLIAAAGNGGKDGVIPFPASHDYTLAIMAIDKRKRAYKHATPGEHVDLAAFGVNVLGASPENKYVITSGSSFATAFLSGMALRSGLCGKEGGPSAMRAAFTGNAIDLGPKGRDDVFGYGLFSLAE